MLDDTEATLLTDYDILLRDHGTLTCRSIDRIYVQGHVPKLQSVGQVCSLARMKTVQAAGVDRDPTPIG